jgi:hypothetical protein
MNVASTSIGVEKRENIYFDHFTVKMRIKATVTNQDSSKSKKLNLET